MAEPEKPQTSEHGEFMGLHAHDGGAMHWHDEFGEHLAEDLPEAERAARSMDWKMHNAIVITVGMDVGSSTTHLMFSRIYLQIVGEGADTRSVAVARELIWRSPIILTPYLDDDTIDVEELRAFVQRAYDEVGATANEIDTGAIILTGEALKRKNARAIADLFASQTGKFVCAAAGHHLEAVLAANGSGTVARSWRDHRTLLNVDMGGGTTKLAIVDDGRIAATAAVAIGARQIVRDENGVITRLDEPAKKTAEHLGIDLHLGGTLSAEAEAQIVKTWIDILADLIEHRPPTALAEELMLTEPLPDDAPQPKAVTFSGGVSEFIFFRENRDFGDLGKPLANALRSARSNGTIKLPSIIDPNLGIRATAIGASLFTVQVGINLYVTAEAFLPMRNVPVLVPKLDLDHDIDPADVASAIQTAVENADMEEGLAPVAIALRWPEEVDPQRVSAVAQGIVAGLPNTIERKVPFVLLSDKSSAYALGETLKEQLNVPGDFISLESVTVSEFDYIDVGEILRPSEVVPVTIKSLLFAGGLDKRSVEQALMAAAKATE